MNRPEILRRLGLRDECSPVDDLLDAYEDGLIAALAEKDKRKPNIGPRAKRPEKE